MASVEIEDHTEEVKEAAAQAVEAALEAVGVQAAGYVSPLAPADTGLLRNSITWALDGGSPAISEYASDDGTKKGTYSGTMPKDGKNERSVYIGTNVEYAAYQEFGTSRIDAKHYIQRGVQNHKSEYNEIIKEYLQNA